MKEVSIEVFNIAKTQVVRSEVEKWLKRLDVSEETIDEYVKSDCTDPALVVALAAKRCYKSFEVGQNSNVTRIRSDIAEYLENILASGHGSVLEHAVYTFAVEGCSRVLTSELNRHRAGVAISEGSARFIRFDNIEFWMPESIKGRGPDTDGTDIFQLDMLELKKYHSRTVFHSAFSTIEDLYSHLQTIWKDELSPSSKFAEKKKITSMMRRIVPMGVATGGTWSFNIRALRHVIGMRATEAAEEEICMVAGLLAKKITELEPMLFCDWKQVDGKFWTPVNWKV